MSRRIDKNIKLLYKKSGAKGVYKIRCIVNDRIYIGSTSNFVARFEAHKKDLLENKHHNKKLQLDFNEYGIKNFEFKRLKEGWFSRGDLYDLEQEYIDKLNPFYNIERVVKRISFKRGKKSNKRKIKLHKPTYKKIHKKQVLSKKMMIAKEFNERAAMIRRRVEEHKLLRN